ncbi:hypothetical protein LTR62_006967 [Meristemomyces frigidus]|uniref:Uncharacterized protein n=1 Tax=Meristemomyces frigidus TaxID=1508187 RepID=A0AAN7TCX0_9PEZI|nr:hypothetical protein LTR62_006967 [Meristemomyces frigidus]
MSNLPDRPPPAYTANRNSVPFNNDDIEPLPLYSRTEPLFPHHETGLKQSPPDIRGPTFSEAGGPSEYIIDLEAQASQAQAQRNLIVPPRPRGHRQYSDRCGCMWIFTLLGLIIGAPIAVVVAVHIFGIL